MIRMASPLVCPRDATPCKTIEYESGIEVDQCPACGGMWLDHGELEAIQRNTEHDYRSQLAELPDDVARGLEVVEQESREAIHCPKCTAQMDTREYAYCSQIVIDTCPDGCGVWLDAGEIQALEVFFERAQAESADSIPLRYRLWASLHELFGK